ncbi:VWA domain-containing protein [Maricaulis sp.]|uniref:vWA domain-containing protein n=1 Tax=Maricaulis sp. TaxID=1486257 RepID=UPI003A8F8273
MRTGTVRRWIGRAGLAALTGAVVIGVLAWDTKDHPVRPAGAATGRHQADSDHAKWAALYNCHQTSTSACRENEHAWLAQLALDRAAPGSPWGLTPDTELTVYDLNGGYFRREIGDIEGAWPDPAAVMGLPRRTLPGAANFAGVPDFSYSIYDWINKNELCPPVPGGQMPAGTYGDCHNYMVWQGGAFNASHFGSQATRSYQRLHATALDLARRAAAMRSRATSPADLELHGDAIREAELMALAYEGYAQHFLQDRWAMGHMFERWGAPEYNANAAALNPLKAILTGGFTGIIHGHQSTTGVPDALSSPEVGLVDTTVQLASRALRGLYLAVGLDIDAEPPPSAISIPVWRHEGESSTYPGVGDYRAWDMTRERYTARAHGVTYNAEVGLPVSQQREEMLACSSAGFRAVIENFGSSEYGGYGIDSVALSSAAPAGPGPECFDIWATNSSMLAGFGAEFIGVGRIADLARSTIRFALPAGDLLEATDALGLTDIQGASGGVITTSRTDAAEMTRIVGRVALSAYADSDGTDVARGGLGTMLGVATGDRFPIASYLEPASLTTLPPIDSRGRDAHTVFGFFNRAGADYFCARSEDILPGLRRSPEDFERATCRILAQRLYRGVHEQSALVDEYLSAIVDGEREAATPLCEVASASWSSPDFDGDGLGALHPGYVAWDFRADRSGAFEMDEEGLSYRSVANWCDETPVVDFSDDAVEAEAGLVAVLEDTRDTLTLNGRHFGDTRGELRIGLTPESAMAITDIESWSDNRIRFSVEEIFSEIEFNDAQQAFLFVTRTGSDDADPGRASVGRFALQRAVRPPQIARIEVSGRERDLYYSDSLPPAPEPIAAAGGDDIFNQPPPPPPVEDQAFWPVPAGERLQIEIEFDTDMERDAEDEAFLFAGQPLEGRWRNARVWRASTDIPEADAYEAMRGAQPISVFARSTRGAWTDGLPQTPGEEPDTSNQILVDPLPVYAEAIEVRGGGQVVYSAQWRGGPDYDAESSLTRGALGDPERVLDVETARDAPATGTGRLRLTLSAPVTEPPRVQVGGAQVEMTGSETRWQGELDFEQAATAEDENGDLQVRIGLGGGRQDADPRTAAVVNEPQFWPRGLFWSGLESTRGGDTTARGGEDLWHRIGPAPSLSLLIILDGSGSMDEQNRMVNAKSGIDSTLDGLPDSREVEFALVSFSDCGSVSALDFTRDRAVVRARIAAVRPAGGTPLAQAHARARQVFAASADPRSGEWRYATFTDGAETCDGNVVAATRQLDALINRHRAPERDPPEPPEQAPPPAPVVNCELDTWRGYEVNVEDGGRHLDTITLVEHSYLERALPDGRCIAQYQTRSYGIYYGSSRNRDGSDVRASWGINSQPSDTGTEFGTSRLGEADLLRVRNAARNERSNLLSLDRARARIASAVEAAQPESG